MVIRADDSSERERARVEGAYDLAAYDLLPTPIKRVIQQAYVRPDCRDALRWWRMREAEGYRPRDAALLMRRIMLNPKNWIKVNLGSRNG